MNRPVPGPMPGRIHPSLQPRMPPIQHSDQAYLFMRMQQQESGAIKGIVDHCMARWYKIMPKMMEESLRSITKEMAQCRTDIINKVGDQQLRQIHMDQQVLQELRGGLHDLINKHDDLQKQQDGLHMGQGQLQQLVHVIRQDQQEASTSQPSLCQLLHQQQTQVDFLRGSMQQQEEIFRQLLSQQLLQVNGAQQELSGQLQELSGQLQELAVHFQVLQQQSQYQRQQQLAEAKEEQQQLEQQLGIQTYRKQQKKREQEERHQQTTNELTRIMQQQVLTHNLLQNEVASQLFFINHTCESNKDSLDNLNKAVASPAAVKGSKKGKRSSLRNVPRVNYKALLS